MLVLAIPSGGVGADIAAGVDIMDAVGVVVFTMVVFAAAASMAGVDSTGVAADFTAAVAVTVD